MSETLSEEPKKTGFLASTQVISGDNHSKEEADIAFAAEAVEAGAMGERQFASALANWTLHGTIPLAEHLAKQRAISRDLQKQLSKRATERLKRLSEGSSARGHLGLSAESLTKTALEQLDPSGRVAKLLGISVATSGVSQDESREHTNRYELVRRLGQGGLGTVWLARDTKLNRLVALKEIRQGQNASEATLERFRREAEITGRLEHPGIVPVYQLGNDSGTGRVFYTMRFLGKKTMQDAIVEYHERRENGDDDPMLLRGLLTAFVSVCQAIGHAHSRKVIHRDLKPENIAIDNFGQVIVIDWGLAKILDDGAVDDSFSDTSLSGSNSGSERTIAGQVLGSPLYMAPEQAAGRVDEIDQSTDVYGLGAILFSILTGYAPHDQSRVTTGTSSTPRELITAIASGPSPTPQTSNSGADGALAAICAKAMSKKRYARYESASQLAEEVQRWMAGEPVKAYHEKFSQRVGRWIQHHRRLSQLLGTFAIMGLVLATTLMITSRQSRMARNQARFEEFRSDGREIELQLQAVAENTAKNVRFMSSLPPIQGIIDAEAGTADTEGLEVWRDRLETIYEGLLRANPMYLGVVYIQVKNDSEGEPLTAKEIVRVERHAVEHGFIRRVPESRLRTLNGGALLEEILQLEPGFAKLALGQRVNNDHSISDRRSLIAAIPVYDDETGNLYGFVAIESNLTEQIETILESLGIMLGEIYVTDSNANVWVQASPSYGVEIQPVDVDVRTILPPVATFFDTESPLRHLTDNTSLIAMRVLLDPHDPSCNLELVMKLIDED